MCCCVLAAASRGDAGLVTAWCMVERGCYDAQGAIQRRYTGRVLWCGGGDGDGLTALRIGRDSGRGDWSLWRSFSDDLDTVALRWCSVLVAGAGVGALRRPASAPLSRRAEIGSDGPISNARPMAELRVFVWEADDCSLLLVCNCHVRVSGQTRWPFAPTRTLYRTALQAHF